MAQALKPMLPHILAYLLQGHAIEWAQVSRGLATYAVRRGKGATVILRSPKLGSERLVSARVLVQVPTDKAGWQDLRTQLLKTDPLGSARYRYLFVPEASLSEAIAAMRRSPVQVRSNNSFKPTLLRKAA